MELSIVIISYNTKELLEACLSRLSEARLSMKHEIYVVDNNSSDGSADLVTNYFPHIQLIVNSSNVGFAGAVNIAFSKSTGKFVLVLNPDVEVSTNSVEILLSSFKIRPNAGLIAPKLLNHDGSLQYSCRADYTLGTFLFRRTFLRRLFPEHLIIRRHLMMDWDHATSRQVDWVLGAAFMLRRKACPDKCVMDDNFFLYFEDVDLCLRLRKSGWQVIYDPGAVMIHRHQRASARSVWNRAMFEHSRSWIKFSWKYRYELLSKTFKPFIASR